MGTYSSGAVDKVAVLDADILHRKRFGTALDDMTALQNIELDSLVAYLVLVHDLVVEGAIEDIEAVDARDFHHMTVMLVLEGHALHCEVLGVSDLDHRV